MEQCGNHLSIYIFFFLFSKLYSSNHNDSMAWNSFLVIMTKLINLDWISLNRHFDDRHCLFCFLSSLILKFLDKSVMHFVFSSHPFFMYFFTSFCCKLSFPISHDKLFMMQVSMAKSSCMFALKELKNWVKPEKVQDETALVNWDRK